MKAIILAAGRGKRMGGLTQEMPKPLLLVAGKTLLDHIFDALPPVVDEVIVVVGFRAEKIRAHLGSCHGGRTVRYLVQKRADGTARAALLAKSFVAPKERLFIIYGDEFPTRHEMQQCLSHTFSWLCHPLTCSIPTGVATVDKKGRIVAVAERRSGVQPPFLSVGGVMLVSGEIFFYRPWRHQNGEYYLTSMLGQFLKDHPVYAVIGRKNLFFSTPEDIARFKKE